MATSRTSPAVGASHLFVDEEWLKLHNEPILEPERPIVDPHHHLNDASYSRYLFDDVLADVGSGHNIVATVFVDCGQMYRADGPPELRSLGETEFANGVAAMSASGQYGPTRVCDGIVGHVDLSHGERIRAVLQAHKAASARFRGIRDITAWHSSETVRNPVHKITAGVMQSPAFREGFAQLAPLGLSFDAWLFHTQLDEFMSLAQAFPETSIILNHTGGPIGLGPYEGKRDEVYDAWSHSIRALSVCKNVTVKLGGLNMRLGGFKFFLRDRPPTSEELMQAWRPYMETCIEAFGTKRCMFESNFPADKGSCSFQVLWNAFKRLASSYSADEKDDLFIKTAQRVYRLGNLPSI